MEAISLTSLDPATIRILSDRPDGSGVIEMPILSEMAEVDLALTASKSTGKESVTQDDLRAAVENFSDWPGPVPVHVYPHRSYTETAGPADGFMDRLFIRAGQLWAQMDLTASLFAEVKARRWRGFSVDLARRVTTATKKFDSMTILGGVFTNRPASDVHAKMAAGTEIEADLRSVYRPIKGEGDGTMEDQDLKVSLATAQKAAEVKGETIVELEGTIKEQKTSLSAAEKRADDAERKLRENENEIQAIRLSSDRLKDDAKEAETRVTSLEGTVKELRAELATNKNESIATKVVSLCKAAIKEGVTPATIAAFGDYERDPVKMVQANFGGSISSFELVLKSLPRVAALRAVKSGHELPGQDDDSAVSPEIAAELRRRGRKSVV